ncbi:hypothetical protein V5799_020234 [Amblyomma americanum]|uniref:Uncharacterized protein n=1 Tax=Amblyomma americanum TaxID=6943 RepID=A0AAQ4EUZ4_AMBAM
MPPPAQRLRPHTFFGRVPQGVCNVDICKVLVTKFSKNELSGVQDFGGGRFEVTFKSKPAVQRFLSDPVIEVRGTAVHFAYRGTLSTVVRVFGFPVDIDVAELRGALEKYGPVESIALEYVPGFDGVPSGTRFLSRQKRLRTLFPPPRMLSPAAQQLQRTARMISRSRPACLSQPACRGSTGTRRTSQRPRRARRRASPSWRGGNDDEEDVEPVRPAGPPRHLRAAPRTVVRPRNSNGAPRSASLLLSQGTIPGSPRARRAVGASPAVPSPTATAAS